MTESALSPSALSIPVGFFLISVVLLWFMIGAKGWWWLKGIFIGIVISFGILVWSSIGTYLGWPSRADLPPKFLVHWASVDEPQNKTDEGAIYLWVLPLEKEEESLIAGLNIDAFSYQEEKTEPRVYRIPYTKQRHQQVQQMLGAIKKGQRFIGGKNAGQGQGKGKGEGKGKGKGTGPAGKGKGKGQGSGSWSFSWRSKDFYIGPLPPPKVPDKIGDQN